ncbi:MAG: HAD family hydrolase [Acidimicrobiia bacterium]
MNYIAFSFDGTIADTRFAICEAMERACIRQGVTYIGDEEFIECIGKDLDELIYDAIVEDIDEELAAKVRQSYKETFRPNLIKMFKGMRRILELCQDAGDVLAIASSRHKSSLHSLIQQLEMKELLTVIVAGDQVQEPKPHQEMLWEVAKELQCNPREIIMVGDTTWDMEMAKDCGATAVGVTWGTHDEVQLRGAGADVVCDSTLALANYFNFAAV